MELCYILSPDIQPLKGYYRSVLYDLTRENFDFIPNELHQNIQDKSFLNIDSTYMNWMEKMEYVLSIPKKMIPNFPELSIKWEFPSELLTFVIHLPLLEEHFESIFKMIEEFNIKSIFIIGSQIKNYSILKKILKILDESRLTIIEIAINYDSNINTDDLTSNTIKLKNLLIYNSPKQEYGKHSEDGFSNITFFENRFENRMLFLQHESYFNVNTELFTESQLQNTYFNRKLYIGINGEIKNAPECEEIFGNIKDIKTPEELKKTITTSKFQKYWYVHKEIIDVCKDCEFRHMCVDNRVPKKRVDNEWYHTQECNYNPYICKWQGEDGYQTLSVCGVISNEKGFSIDHERITEINNVLWEE